MAVPETETPAGREEYLSEAKSYKWQPFNGESCLRRLRDFNRLLSIMIHQTRNYCMSAKGYVSLLECDGIGSEKGEEWLSKISRGMNGLENFLSGFETYRPSKHQKKERIGVRDVIREVWGMLIEQSNRSIEINMTLDQDAIVVGDTEDFKKMVYHILKNSFEAIEDGGRISVDLSRLEGVDEGSRGWVLEFQDNGTGMNEQILSKAGRLLFTTKQGHVGCGLNLAAAVINRMGAVAEVSSKQGLGTVIKIKKVN